MLAWWILPSGLGRAQTIHGEMLLLDGIQSPESSLKNCQNNFPPVYTFKNFFCTIFFFRIYFNRVRCKYWTERHQSLASVAFVFCNGRGFL